MPVKVKTIGHLFKKRLLQSLHHQAIGWIENNQLFHLTYEEYQHQIELLLTTFKVLDISPKTHIALLAQTSKEWHLIDMASLLSRLCVVPLYPASSSEDIAYILDHSDSSILVVDDEKRLQKLHYDLHHSSHNQTFKKLFPKLRLVLTFQDVTSDFKNHFDLPLFSLKEILQMGKENLAHHPRLLDHLIESQQENDVASLIYTSGTTGAPKGVVITQKALTTMLLNVQDFTHGAFNEEDRTLTFLPLSHVLGRCDSLLLLIFGWETVFAPADDNLYENIKLVQPTIMIGVPTIYETLALKIKKEIQDKNFLEKKLISLALSMAKNYFQKMDQNLSPTFAELYQYKWAFHQISSQHFLGENLRYLISGGSSLSDETLHFIRCFGITILEGYGLTETIAPCFLNPLHRQIPGTVGVPMGDVSFKLSDDHEILLKTEALFTEYYKDSALTQKVFEHGYFHTGDIGEISPENHLIIKERKSDLIHTSDGKIISPQKIEQLAQKSSLLSYLLVVQKGDSLNALVGIEKDVFLDRLEEFGLSLDCSIKTLAQNPQVHHLLEKEIFELNKKLLPHEQIKNFRLLPEEISLMNYLTPSLKMKRRLVLKKYQHLLNC